MVTVNALSLGSNGETTTVHVRRNDAKQWFIKTRTPLYVHYESTRLGIVLLSPTHTDRLMSSSTPVFTFPLPPPLNTHIYPNNLVVASLDSEQNPVNLESSAFSKLCEDLIASASMKSFGTDFTVYDVPALPMLSAEDDLESYFEEEEEEEEDFDSEAESEEIDDDDAWDEDDSVI